jgi:hypothetical protein
VVSRFRIPTCQNIKAGILENIIETAVRLASNTGQTARQSRHSRGQCPRRPTPRPSPDPLPVWPRIHVSPPIVPSPLVTQPIPTRQPHRQFLQPIVRTPQPPRSGPSSGDEIVFVPGAENAPLLCYYPETFFIATTLPTRTFTELRLFKEHCQDIYNNHWQPVELHVTNCDVWTVFSFSLPLFIMCTITVSHVTDDFYFHT